MVTPLDYDNRLQAVVRPAVVPLTEQLRRVPPNRVAALIDSRIFTYGQLTAEAHLAAENYRDHGVKAGTVVGVQLANSWAFMVAHVALAELGAVMATLHRPLTDRECHALLEFVGASFWLNPEGWEALRDIPAEPTAANERPLDGQWPLAIFYTSGTQSLRPKPCLHSHQTLLGNAAVVARDGEMNADDVFISASPFTHLFGILSCHLAWVLGARQIIIERYGPRGFLNSCRNQGATIAFMVPTHIRDLLDYLREHPEESQGVALREIRTAGAAVSPDLADRVFSRLEAKLVNHWGMSEIGGGTYTHWRDEVAVAAESIGRPSAGAQVMLLDESGRVVETPDVPGEMLFRGPSLFYGYYGNSKATNEALYQDAQGQWWLRTGDIVSWSNQGRLRYLGRLKDIVNRGGVKIDALEIEHAVLTLEGIRTAALVAEPDTRLGERATLVIERTNSTISITLTQVQQHLAQFGIAKFKWPERLVIWDKLPTTPTGKLAKARIREQLRQAPVANANAPLSP